MPKTNRIDRYALRGLSGPSFTDHDRDLVFLELQIPMSREKDRGDKKRTHYLEELFHLSIDRELLAAFEDFFVLDAVWEHGEGVHVAILSTGCRPRG